MAKQKLAGLRCGAQDAGHVSRVRASILIAYLFAVSAASQTVVDTHGATTAMPLQNVPPAKIFVHPPLAKSLSLGAAVVEFRTANLRIAPVFGVGALSITPRVGHIHVSVDDADWVWAHTTAEPAIVAGLTPGQHKIRLQLMTANHQRLDEGVVKFTVPRGHKGGPTPTHTVREAHAEVVQPPSDQPPARIIVDSPLAEPLSRGVVFIRYRTENLHIVPVFGRAAVDVSPRIGHIHVIVDDVPWFWADASGNPVIIQGLAPGRHRILIDLANADDHVLTRGTVEVTLPDPNSKSKVESIRR